MVVQSFLDSVPGQPQVIECHVQGIPIPTVSWTRNDVTLPYNRVSMSLNCTSNTTHIARLAITGGDSAVYACVATNGAGSVSKVFRIGLDGECSLQKNEYRPDTISYT